MRDFMLRPTRRRSLLAITPFLLAACGGGASRYQGMDAEALFQLATIEFEEEEYDNAIETLDRLLLSYGSSPRAAEARLMLGDAHFAEEEYLTARTQYQRFIDRHAGHPSSPDAALGICRSLAALVPVAERDQGYTEEGIANCRNVVIDYQGLPQARAAGEIANELRQTLAEKEFKTGEFYHRRNLRDSAVIYYQMVVDRYPETEWAPKALLGLYRANLEIGYEDLAADARELLLERYPDSAEAAEIRETGRNG